MARDTREDFKAQQGEWSLCLVGGAGGPQPPAQFTDTQLWPSWYSHWPIEVEGEEMREKHEQMIEHLVGEKSPGGFWELVKWTEATQSHTENQFS